jgi:hypothetical protein
VKRFIAEKRTSSAYPGARAVPTRTVQRCRQKRSRMPWPFSVASLRQPQWIMRSSVETRYAVC